MRLVAGCGDRELRVLSRPRFMQARDEVAWQERAVAGGAEHPFDLRPVRRGPVERGQNAGERAGEAGHVIGNDLQAERGEARRIAVRIEDQSVALGLQARDHALQDGAAADGPHRFVATAHAACEAAGEQDALRCRNFSRHQPSPLRLCFADSSST